MQKKLRWQMAKMAEAKHVQMKIMKHGGSFSYSSSYKPFSA